MKEKYIGTAEIVESLQCGRTYANEIMHRFEARGQAYKVGNRYKVKERIFTDWLERECRIPSLRERSKGDRNKWITAR